MRDESMTSEGAGRGRAPAGRPRASMPRHSSWAVQRPRLLRELATAWMASDPGPQGAGTDGSDAVLLVCAPAGYGKTTMLVELAGTWRSGGGPVVWVTCDREDDVISFWDAVVTAAGEAGLRDSARLAASNPSVRPAGQGFVAPLLSALAEQLPGLLLVLDDVHEVQPGPVLDGIQRLLESADGRVRVALGGRFEPAAGLYRLRLTGRLHEVRAAQLAFRPDEAEDFWQRHHIALAPEQQDTLMRLTEGWPAGLRLAALSLENEQDPASFVAEFSGADRPVADYLVHEVLVRLPGDVVDFLLRTCVVEDLAQDLAVRLSGRDDAGAVLEDLVQRNAFVAQVDRTGTWFRYHVLLRTYLAAALQRRDPATRAALHRQAARWFLEHRQPRQAIELATVVADHELVQEILLTHGLELLLAGAGATVRRAVSLWPATAQAPPAVLVHRALMAVDEGHLAAADEVLAALEAAPPDSDHRVTSLRGLAHLHRARLAADHSALRDSELAVDVGPSHLPPDLDPDVRLLVLADRGALRLTAGDLRGARDDLDRAGELASAAGMGSVQLHCKVFAAGALLAGNDFRGAGSAADQALAFAAEKGWETGSLMAYPHMVAAWSAFQALEPDVAAVRAEAAVALVDPTLDVEVRALVRTGEAIIAFDDPPSRRAALERLRRATGRFTDEGASRALTASAAHHELRMRLATGDWNGATRVVDHLGRRLGADSGDVAVLRAQLACAHGRPRDAHGLLVPVLRGDQALLMAPTCAWLFEALLAQRSDRRPAATDALLAALEVASATGGIRPFFDAGAEVQELLQRLRGRAGHLEDVLDGVLEGIARVRARQEAATRHDGATTPGAGRVVGQGQLTQRELVVLRDLPSFMTLSEIADAQGVSLNTAKTHVRSIYTKLDVRSRRDAIRRARELGVL